MLNPFYDSEKLGLKLLSFEEPGMCYEFNTLIFLATEDGRVYTAHDSGCSCPIPFEDYEGENQEEVLKLLERVGSVEQAERTFDSWNSFDDKLPQSSKNSLTDWINNHLKQF